MLDRVAAAQPARAAGARWLVPLPRGAEAPIRVFVNGVPQRQGADYQLEHRTLVFTRPLAKEGKLGFWRWLSMFLGIAGTYRQNDSVDVQYQRDGRSLIATGLDIVGPGDERQRR